MEDDEKLKEFIAHFIPQNSPFFNLYSGQTNKLEDLLHIEGLSEVKPPTFRETLSIYIRQAYQKKRCSKKRVAQIAGIPVPSTLIYQIVNDSGAKSRRGYRYP